MSVAFEVDGRPVEVEGEDATPLLEVLRDRLGLRSPKDGCSPQGQCGCCTVLVDGSPRVSCVTPTRRVAGRSVTTLDGLAPAVREEWARAFTAAGASQCGFCTPGIIMRLEGHRAKDPGAELAADQVEQAMAAHLCRCTGWQTITEAAVHIGSAGEPTGGRDLDAAGRRATIEGRSPQRVGPDVAEGRGGFADDGAPEDALVAVPDGEGWAVGETLSEARLVAGKVQGRRTTIDPVLPLTVVRFLALARAGSAMKVEAALDQVAADQNRRIVAPGRLELR
jgi:xanthine dehydrogenase small subunit